MYILFITFYVNSLHHNVISLHHGDQTRYCDRKTSSNSQLAKHHNRVPMMPDILVKDCFFT